MFFCIDRREFTHEDFILMILHPAIYGDYFRGSQFLAQSTEKKQPLILSALCRPRWLIRSAYGSKLRGTWFESRSRWIFVIDVGYIHCSKPFKCMECAVLSMRVRTIKNPQSHSIRVGHSPDFGLPPVSILS